MLFAPLFTKVRPDETRRWVPAKAFIDPTAGTGSAPTDRPRHLDDVLYGGRISLAVGLAVAVFSTSLGTIVGVFAGYYGGWLDNLLMRVTDLFLAIPFLVVAILLRGFPAQQLGGHGHGRPESDARAVIFLIAVLLDADRARSCAA